MDAVCPFAAAPELMAQDNKFQRDVKALAEPRPHCGKLSKDPSRHEL